MPITMLIIDGLDIQEALIGHFRFRVLSVFVDFQRGDQADRQRAEALLLLVLDE